MGLVEKQEMREVWKDLATAQCRKDESSQATGYRSQCYSGNRKARPAGYETESFCVIDISIYTLNRAFSVHRQL